MTVSDEEIPAEEPTKENHRRAPNGCRFSYFAISRIAIWVIAGLSLLIVAKGPHFTRVDGIIELVHKMGRVVVP